MLTEKQQKVLSFLAEKLKENNIPFQATGGLAAIAYGATRPLYDIDLEVNHDNILQVRKLFMKYIDDDFYRLQDENFDIYPPSQNTTVHFWTVDECEYSASADFAPPKEEKTPRHAKRGVELHLLTLNIDGVPVDIGQAENNSFSRKNGKQVRLDSDLSKAKVMEISGIKIPVEDKEELIRYKQVMARPCDLQDIVQITARL